MYTIGEFAKRVGVAVQTIQRWDREGRLTAHRTLNNRRYYTDEDIQTVLGVAPPPEEYRQTVVYCRVSSHAQKPDLTNQRHVIEQFCVARGLVVDEWIEEIGGGLNFKRNHFLRLMDQILAGDVKMLVIAHKDRLVRFGYEFIEHLCQTHGCEMLVINTESLSPEQEMVQDLMTILHCFSRRLSGLRNYKKALKEALAHGNDSQGPQDPTVSDT
jgi:putative resolvase